MLEIPHPASEESLAQKIKVQRLSLTIETEMRFEPGSPTIDGFSSSVFNNVQLSERDALPFFLLNFSPFLFF